MADIVSTPSQPNLTSSSSSASAAAMSSLKSLEPHESGSAEPLCSETRTPIHGASDPQTDTATAGIEAIPAEMETLFEKETEESANERDGDEEVGECGFCLFMKEGGCREAFVGWEECVEEAEKKEADIVEKCFQVTQALKKCMDVHSDYYAPILQAEKSMEEEAVKQLEEEKEKERLNSEGESENKEEQEALRSTIDSKK